MDLSSLPLSQLIYEGKALYEAREFAEAHQRMSLAIGRIESESDRFLPSEEEIAELYALRASALIGEDEKAAFDDPDIFFQVIQDMEQAIELQPAQALYYRMRADLYEKCTFADYSSEARADYEQVLELLPENEEALLELAQLSSRAEQYEEAIGYLDRLLRQSDHAEALLLRGMCMIRKAIPDLGAAISDFGKVQQLRPNLEEPYVWRATCYQELDQTDLAIAEYDKLLAIAPQKAEYYVDRGAIRALVDPAGALADYTEAIRLAGHPLAYNNRAFYYLENQRLEEALRDLEAGLPQAEDYPVLYATAAEIYAAAGERARCLAYLKLALRHYYEDSHDALASPFLSPWLQDEEFQALLMGAAG